MNNVEILVNGKPIKKYYDSGNTWVEAHEGSKYSVQVKNDSSIRKLVVISVDGVNIITGKKATIEASGGYVLEAYGKLIIDGWRISDDKVKEFIFTFNKNKSYACKSGNGYSNLGVIGILQYDEQQFFTNNHIVDYWKWANDSTSKKEIEPYYTITCANTCDSMSSLVPQEVYHSAPEMKAGTAKGNELDSKVTCTSFSSSSNYTMTSIYYNSRKELIKANIIKPVQKSLPKPFLATNYCKDI